MFRDITFNGTDKKEIGAPILRKTNEMIYEFDLQYERNYKINKIISQREIEFQEYLKQQEALQYRLDNLIKILRSYFKENNYNQNTYYNLFKPRNNNIISKKRKKRKRRNRPKTTEIKRNKYLFYKITKNNFYFNKFKPYLYPLTNKDRKIFERKIYTDINLKEKEKNNYYNMSPAQLKKFVDVFGFIPVMFKKEEEDEEKERNTKKNKKKRNYSTYDLNKIKNKNNQSIRDQLRYKRGKNNIYLRAQSTNKNKKNDNDIINIIKNNDNYLKSTHSISINNNKENFKLNNNKSYRDLKPKFFNQNNNRISYNNRYLNINNYINIRSNNNFNSKNFNLNNNLNNFINNSPKTSTFIIENSTNIFNNNYNKLNKIKIKKNINLENLKKNSFTNQCIKTIQKSEVLNKDLKYLNKAYDLSYESLNNKKYKIEKSSLKQSNFLSFIQIYEKDFRPDLKKQLEKKYEHIKEGPNGHIAIKKVEFIRKPKCKLNFVQVYNKRREQKNMNRIDFIFNNDDEEKTNLIPFKMKRSLERIKLKKNKFSKYNIFASSSLK